MRDRASPKKNDCRNNKRRSIFLLALVSVAFLLFLFLIVEVVGEKDHRADIYIFNFLSAYAINPANTALMKIITGFAAAPFLRICYSILVIFFVISKNYRRAIEIAVIGLGGFLMNYFMKISFQRARPSDPLIDPLQNFSFPSGHATSGFIFYGVLAWLIWQAPLPRVYKYLGGILLILFAMLIGLSRIYLRVHYASDVLAGFCMGFIWLSVTILLFEKLRRRSNAGIGKN